MKLYIAQADLVVRCNPHSARIWAIGRPRPEHRRTLPQAHKLIVTPNDCGWSGDDVVTDYFGMVTLENFLRCERPQWRHSTIRRHLRAMVQDGGFMGDMLRLRDGADHMQIALPWVGECEWLAKECYRSAFVGPIAVRLEQVAAGQAPSQV